MIALRSRARTYACAGVARSPSTRPRPKTPAREEYPDRRARRGREEYRGGEEERREERTRFQQKTEVRRRNVAVQARPRGRRIPTAEDRCKKRSRTGRECEENTSTYGGFIWSVVWIRMETQTANCKDESIGGTETRSRARDAHSEMVNSCEFGSLPAGNARPPSARYTLPHRPPQRSTRTKLQNAATLGAHLPFCSAGYPHYGPASADPTSRATRRLRSSSTAPRLTTCLSLRRRSFRSWPPTWPSSASVAPVLRRCEYVRRRCDLEPGLHFQIPHVLPAFPYPRIRYLRAVSPRSLERDSQRSCAVDRDNASAGVIDIDAEAVHEDFDLVDDARVFVFPGVLDLFSSMDDIMFPTVQASFTPASSQNESSTTSSASDSRLQRYYAFFHSNIPPITTALSRNTLSHLNFPGYHLHVSSTCPFVLLGDP
ncbi:hypothetical protein B0H12DRAFT_1067258 [Mycena haematopus]|nr:hypothetical protein B0H12DRAFT_1067258 [Mycena haematopus]